jgi:hypothetical protein
MPEKEWNGYWFIIHSGRGSCVVFAEDEDQALTVLEKRHGTANGPYRIQWSGEFRERPPGSLNGGAFIDATEGPASLRSYPTGRPVIPMWMQLMVRPEDGGLLTDGDSLGDLLQSGVVAACEECGGYYFRGSGSTTHYGRVYKVPRSTCDHKNPW